MKKIFLIGDNEDLVGELSRLLEENFEIADELSEDTEIVFELTIHDKDTKFRVLEFIDSKNHKAVVVSNSNCITLIEQSHALKDPARLVGASFFPGFTDAKGIEITSTAFTNPENLKSVSGLFAGAGKEIIISPDRPGMIMLRILALIINEAYLVLQEGTSNAEDIDIAMKLGTNYPVGPIEWSNKLGLELVYKVLSSMHEEFGDDRYRITPLLKEKYLESSLQS